MRRDRGIAAKYCGIDRNKLRGFLTDMHPVKTAAAVAAELREPERTVQHWLAEDGGDPRAAALLKMVAVYGPEFLAAVMTDAPEWLREASRKQQRAALAAQLAATKRALAALDDTEGDR